MSYNKFFCSDSHFGHANIIKYSCRPFSNVQEMNEKMLETWNKMVGPNDDIYHLGDVSFMKYLDTKKYLSKLNGNIHLILGNHDRSISQHREELLNEQVFASIQDYKELTIDTQLFVLFHYGQRVWRNSHHGSIHLYGHSHGSLPPFGRSVDVGFDCKEITSEYRPIHLDEIIAYMKNRSFESADHHKE